MNNKEIRREIKKLINKCIYLNIYDFIDTVYSHFEKIGIYEYALINKNINDLQEYVIYKK